MKQREPAGPGSRCHTQQLLQEVAAVIEKGHDSKAVVTAVAEKGAEAVIPTLSSRKQQWEIDKDRNLAERFCSKIKQFRRVVTRSEESARNKSFGTVTWRIL